MASVPEAKIAISGVSASCYYSVVVTQLQLLLPSLAVASSESPARPISSVSLATSRASFAGSQSSAACPQQMLLRSRALLDSDLNPSLVFFPGLAHLHYFVAIKCAKVESGCT